MTKSIQAVLFDLDGTLLDTAPTFHLALNQLLEEQNLPAPSTKLVTSNVSYGSGGIIKAAFNLEASDVKFKPLQNRILELYYEQITQGTTLFAGIKELLDELDKQQIAWGVITNKPQRYTDKLLEEMNLIQRAGVVFSSDQLNQPKPDPEGLLRACQKINIKPEQAIYIGDHCRDIEAAHRAGMNSIAACYGYLKPNENWQAWQAQHSVTSAQEILPLINHLNQV